MPLVPRPRRLGRAALASLTGLAFLLLGACERRVEEPLAARPLDPSSLAASPSPLSGAPAGPKRCIKPTPAAPVRTSTGPAARCPRDDEARPPKLRAGKVTFLVGEAAGGQKEIPVEVEVAESEHDRQRGLMFRTQMADDHGMIFVFGEKTDHSFWMHNTCIPLDMLFIDEDGLIVGIEENTPTLSDDTFSVGCESKYVLEVNAGYCRAHGIKAGQWLKIEL